MLAVAAALRLGDFELDVRFEMPTPGVVALFGRSGCGKSTVVGVMAGLRRPSSGRIVLDDSVLLDTQSRVDVPPERRAVGCVFQDARLFPHLSVAGNLRYAVKRATRTPYVDFDTVVQLLDLAPLMERRTHALSGGERQRVAIGRALLSQPRILLLDEPLAALDEARREDVLPYLESLRDRLRIPMVYVTHDFSEVMRLATHIVLMDAGLVIAQGLVGEMSLHPSLRSIIGPDEVGAILDGMVIGIDPATRLTRVRVGSGEINIAACDLAAGSALRLQLLARDVIISTRAPHHLSVRNSLAGCITRIQGDDEHSDLVTLEIGGGSILARITKSATRELSLQPGMPAWALVKSVSLRGHAFAARRTVAAPAGAVA
jgi:molybdate transport system ATP-binding protein